LEFKTLSNPIEIDSPVKAKFTEYHIYQDIALSFADSIRVSVTTNGITPDTFLLREIVQNAVNSEIQKTGDFLTSYKKVKVEGIGKWKKVESSGTLTEDIFILGHSTKEEVKNKPCKLLSSFGIGLIEGIFMALYCGKHIVMVFNGHIYGFGYYYNDKLYYDLDQETIMKHGDDIRPVIFRGEYDVTDKVVFYVPETVGSVLGIFYPYKELYHVDVGDRGAVYHNGVFSGYWDVPLDLNVCYVSTDQYHLHAFVDEDFVKAIDMIADPGIKDAFIEIMKRYIKSDGLVSILSVPYDIVSLFDLATPKLRNILQDALNTVVEDMVKALGDKVVIVDELANIPSRDLLAIGLPSIEYEYIDNLKSYLKSKGYTVLSYGEAVGGKLMERYEAITEPTVSDDIMALIKLGKWLYQIGFIIMKMNDIPGWEVRWFRGIDTSVSVTKLDPSIANIPVKILKPEYEDVISDNIGATLYIGNKVLILLRHLPDEEKAMYVGVVIHELNHVFLGFGHGEYGWESIYDVLCMIDMLGRDFKNEVTNLIRLAMYNPKLFLQINDISGLSGILLPEELIKKGECRGYIVLHNAICTEDSSYILRLVNRNGTLVLEQSVPGQ
jgi:hypothetical protein